MRCVNLLQFDTRWFYWFRFSALCNLRNRGNVSQTFATRLSNVRGNLPNTRNWQNMLRRVTKYYDVSQRESVFQVWSNVTNPCHLEQFQHLSQVLPDESFLQNWFSAWYDFLKIVAGCSNVQTVPNWFTPASVCAIFANVHTELRNLRAWRKMNQFVSTDSFRHTVLTCTDRYNYNSW